ncbi:MAG: LapA family protein [Burkholderiales bacterium]|nr:LapA family protein [Burkholderiales bacterium]
MKSLLKALSWGARIVLFAAVFLLAAKNTEPVTVRLLFDAAWHAPLALVVLVVLACGAALGILACLPGLARQRREIAALRAEAAAGARKGAEPVPPPDPAADVPSQY